MGCAISIGSAKSEDAQPSEAPRASWRKPITSDADPSCGRESPSLDSRHHPERARTMNEDPSARRLPRSLYADTARERPATPPLAGDLRVGPRSSAVVSPASRPRCIWPSGASTSRCSKPANPAGGASGRNGGQVNPGLKSEPSAIERDFGAALGARMVALSGDAPRRVFDLIREHQIQCEADQTGTNPGRLFENLCPFPARRH